MKINPHFIVKLALGFVAIGGLLILAGFAMSGFSWQAYSSNHHAWYRTFNVSGDDYGVGMHMNMDMDSDDSYERAAEEAEEGRELAAEQQEEKSEAISEIQEALSELRREARELQGVDQKKAAEVSALIDELETTLEK